MAEKIITSSYYPYINLHLKRKKYNALIGIGGNVGNTIGYFHSLFKILSNNTEIDVIQTSIIYKNPAFGYEKQRFFLNSVISVAINFSYYEFYSYCMFLERRLSRGRKREFKNGPRTIDIDIIFFDNKKIRKKYLNIPHKEWINRKSVIIPLLYLQ